MIEVESADINSWSEQYLHQARVYELLVPKAFVWEPERAQAFMQSMLSIFQQLTFVIKAEPDRITWQVIDLWHRLPDELIQRAIHSVYPEVQIRVSPYLSPDWTKPFYRSVILYQQVGDFVAPMQSVVEMKKIDPLAALVQGMAGLQPGERMLHVLHVMGAASPTLIEDAERRITVSKIHPLQFLSSEGIGRALGTFMSGNTRMPRYEARDQRILEERLRHGNLYNAFLMSQLDSPSEAGLIRLANLVNSILQFASDYNALAPLQKGGASHWKVGSPDFEQKTNAFGILGAWFQGHDLRYQKVWAVLSTDELAGLWHLPHQGFAAPEISRLAGGQVPMPLSLAKNTRGIELGQGVYAGRDTFVRMLDQDRATHISIIGKTGTGKSSLMHTMIHQDIRDGRGVGVIDPHGSLIRDILQSSIPESREDDVVLIDIANENNPPPLNPLIVPGELNHLAAGQIMAILEKIYNVDAKRVEDTLTAALMTIRQEQTPTVRDVVRLFTDISYRHRFLPQVEDIVTQEFWEAFEMQSPSVQRELSYPVLHRMRHFYRNPTLYPMLCHPDALDFAGLIDRQKIILVSLAADERKLPSPEQQLLGAVVVSQLQMAVMQNIGRTPSYHLYIDETQNYVTTSLEKLLDESRKFGLALTMANQFLGQLKGSILESVTGNVGATVVFQCGLNDAKSLAPYYQPGFTAEDLMNQPLYSAAVKMRLSGQTLPAFTLKTLPPPSSIDKEQALAREKRIRQRSVAQYTPQTREQVLEWLAKRYSQGGTGMGNEQKEDIEDRLDWSVQEEKDDDE